MRLEIKSVLKENWLTRRRGSEKLAPTLALSGVITLATLLYWSGGLNANAWMSASPNQVFQSHEYWRLWSTLFAHGDAAHLLGNLLLFTPFAFLLWSTFGTFLFPVLGIALGGLINFFVLQTMSGTHSLIGISGVVYWMGTVWITLAYFIDRREPRSRRALKAMGVFLLLFIPDAYQPNVSYLSHALGAIFGFVSAVIFFHMNEKKFLKAETYEWKLEVDDSDEWEWQATESSDSRHAPPLKPCTQCG